LEDKLVSQVIAFAGSGKLQDGGVTSKEFREFLAQIPSPFLSRYADECLTTKFDGNGFALQDVINEVPLCQVADTFGKAVHGQKKIPRLHRGNKL
jgi:hypothetical protein